MRIVGNPRAPSVLILGGISADRRIVAAEDESEPGWWEEIVTRSSALNRLTLVGADFPATLAHHAELITRACREAGIERLHAIVGASYGGMVALAIAERSPAFAGRVIAISAAHASHPMAQAHRWIQREIIALGQAAGRPEAGVALARALAMTTYRTAQEFRERFGHGPEAARQVAGYLSARGTSYAERVSPETVNRLTRLLDSHWVEPARITVRVDLIGVHSDTLVPPWQLAELASALGPRGTLTLIDSRYGHDAFLKEPAAIARLLDTLLPESGS